MWGIFHGRRNSYSQWIQKLWMKSDVLKNCITRRWNLLLVLLVVTDNYFFSFYLHVFSWSFFHAGEQEWLCCWLIDEFNTMVKFVTSWFMLSVFYVQWTKLWYFMTSVVFPPLVWQVSDLQLVSYAFTSFGKALIRKRKLHPDTFVQLALQLAYYKCHGR